MPARDRTDGWFDAVVRSFTYDKDFTDATRLEEDIGMDSLDMVDLALSLEQATGADVPDDDVLHWRTVGDVRHYLRRRGHNV